MTLTPEQLAPRYETLEDLTKVAVFVVEASSFEHQSLWERWAKQSASPVNSLLDWRDCGRGWLIQVGTLDRRPINLNISGATLNGYNVLFYEAVSQVIDWAQIEKWFKKHCWPKWDNGTRRAHCDAMNFHHCVEVVSLRLLNN
jgi:hypothetical protein